MGLADFIKVYRFLRGIRYPATKQQLVDQARSNQADEEALTSLREMPTVTVLAWCLMASTGRVS